MNKLVKGSIAGAAGIALLLGGAGTLALWNANTTAGIGSVTSGVLSLQSAGAGVWADKPAIWVPEDSATYTQNFTVTATGDNLDAELTAATASETDQGFTVTPSFVVKDSSNATVTPTAGVYTLSAGTYTVEATVTVTFDADDQDNQGATATFSDVIAINLQQI